MGARRSRAVSPSAVTSSVIKRALSECTTSDLRSLSVASSRSTFLAALQLIHPGGTFRPHQDRVLHDIQSNSANHIVVLSMGSGKIEIIMLAAHAQMDQVTIGVVPTVVLQNQLQARCAKLGVTAMTWKGLSTCATVVLVMSRFNRKLRDAKPYFHPRKP